MSAVAFPLSLGVIASLGGLSTYAAPEDPPTATVKVWDTASMLPLSESLGSTPGESIEDPTGLSGHATGSPTIATLYAGGTHPGGRSGIAYWNPDRNTFTWYGKTTGFPSGAALNRSGPTIAGGPVDPGPDGVPGTFDDRATSFGPGDVWVAGHQLEFVYVHIAGTDMFRTYGMSDASGPADGKRGWAIVVDHTTGYVYLSEPEGGRIARINPVTGITRIWIFGASPAYMAFDAAGNLYTTLSETDMILRINRDESSVLWRIPSANGIAPSFRLVPHANADSGTPGDNANDILPAADGSIWFLETNSNEVGRLSGGADQVIGTADDEICEFTSPGLFTPQQIATAGAGRSQQVLFTEGDGNSVSVLTQTEVDAPTSLVRRCTPVPAEPFDIIAFDAATTFFDEKVVRRQTSIVPTVHQITGVGGPASGTTRTSDGKLMPALLRFSPMPNPSLSLNGIPFGNAGNGFPSGLTGVYGGNRIAGAYLKGNKHFEVTSTAILAAAPVGP
jgi:hypothetical protein